MKPEARAYSVAERDAIEGSDWGRGWRFGPLAIDPLPTIHYPLLPPAIDHARDPAHPVGLEAVGDGETGGESVTICAGWETVINEPISIAKPNSTAQPGTTAAPIPRRSRPYHAPRRRGG